MGNRCLSLIPLTPERRQIDPVLVVPDEPVSAYNAVQSAHPPRIQLPPLDIDVDLRPVKSTDASTQTEDNASHQIDLVHSIDVYSASVPHPQAIAAPVLPNCVSLAAKRSKRPQQLRVLIHNLKASGTEENPVKHTHTLPPTSWSLQTPRPSQSNNSDDSDIETDSRSLRNFSNEQHQRAATPSSPVSPQYVNSPSETDIDVHSENGARTVLASLRAPQETAIADLINKHHAQAARERFARLRLPAMLAKRREQRRQVSTSLVLVKYSEEEKINDDECSMEKVF